MRIDDLLDLKWTYCTLGAGSPAERSIESRESNQRHCGTPGVFALIHLSLDRIEGPRKKPPQPVNGRCPDLLSAEVQLGLELRVVIAPSGDGDTRYLDRLGDGAIDLTDDE